MKSVLGLAKTTICKPPRFCNTTNIISTVRVMAGDTCRTHLLNITRLLNEFESKPKKIEGNLITDWFNVGEDLFEEFYNLGTSVKWNSSKIKEDRAVVDVVTGVTRNQGWLQSFLSIYPGLRVDAEGAAPAAAVCRVRSGLELLLRGLAGLAPASDAVLRDLQDLGELDEFDHSLKIWSEGHRPDFFPGDLHPDTPETHWWWF